MLRLVEPLKDIDPLNESESLVLVESLIDIESLSEVDSLTLSEPLNDVEVLNEPDVLVEVEPLVDFESLNESIHSRFLNFLVTSIHLMMTNRLCLLNRSSIVSHSMNLTRLHFLIFLMTLRRSMSQNH